MKNKKLLALAMISAIIFLSFKPLNSFFRESGSIGDVKYSILDYKAFKAANGDSWVQLNGQSLDINSDLYKLLKDRTLLTNVLDKNDKLPNAEGMFIRGVDLNSNKIDSIGDPDYMKRKNQIGSYQKSQSNNIEKVIFNWGKNTTATKIIPDNGDISQPITSGKEGQNNTKDRLRFKKKGVETRPQNINLYTYIKINN